MHSDTSQLNNDGGGGGRKETESAVVIIRSEDACSAVSCKLQRRKDMLSN